MVGIKDIAPDLLMPAGCLTRKTPDQSAASDIAKGLDMLRALSPFDVGQAVVVIDGHVVGVEGIERNGRAFGSYRPIARRQGQIRAKAQRGVLVKAPKHGQDLRYDLPTLGPQTIENAAAAGLAGMAVVAGNTLVAEPQALVGEADASSLFVVGLSA